MRPAQHSAPLTERSQLAWSTAAVESDECAARERSRLLSEAYDKFCEAADEGAAPVVNEFCAQYPGIENSLRRLLEVHHWVSQQASVSDPLERLDAGDSIGGFELVEELGRGGFARVFLAREFELGDRPVVLKVSVRQGGEPRLLGKLNHANVVPVLSTQVDAETGLTLLCMPYIGRETLLDTIDESGSLRRPRGDRARSRPTASPAEVEEFLSIAAQIADGLAHAHDRGVLHLDLKPSNVLRAFDGRFLLLDFNLAREADSLEDVGGTLPYMAPEMLRALVAPRDRRELELEQISAKADLYSLGVLLYEMIMGDLPRPLPDSSERRERIQALLARSEEVDYVRSRLRAVVDGSLADLVCECLAPDSAARPESAAALARRLRRLSNPQSRVSRRLRFHRLKSLAVVVLICAGIIAGGVYWSTRPDLGHRSFAAGLTAFAAGDDRLAVQQFSNAIEHYPHSASALFARGRAFQRLGQFELASHDYWQAGELSGSPLPKALRAYCSYILRHPSSAVHLYEEVLAANYESVAILNNLACSYLISGKLPEAERCLQRAFAYPSTPPPMLHVNRVRLAMRQYTFDSSRVPSEEILASLDLALDAYPDVAELHWEGVYVWLAARPDDRERVIRHLVRALELGLPKSAVDTSETLKSLLKNPEVQQAYNSSIVKPRVPFLVVLDPLDDQALQSATLERLPRY